MVNVNVKDEEQANASQTDGDRDSPLLDMSDSVVKKFIKAAKARGYVTYEDLNKVLPSEEVTSDQIEDLYATVADGRPVEGPGGRGVYPSVCLV